MVLVRHSAVPAALCQSQQLLMAAGSLVTASGLVHKGLHWDIQIPNGNHRRELCMGTFHTVLYPPLQVHFAHLASSPNKSGQRLSLFCQSVPCRALISTWDRVTLCVTASTTHRALCCVLAQLERAHFISQAALCECLAALTEPPPDLSGGRGCLGCCPGCC